MTTSEFACSLRLICLQRLPSHYKNVPLSIRLFQNAIHSGMEAKKLSLYHLTWQQTCISRKRKITLGKIFQPSRSNTPFLLFNCVVWGRGFFWQRSYGFSFCFSHIKVKLFTILYVKSILSILCYFKPFIEDEISRYSISILSILGISLNKCFSIGAIRIKGDRSTRSTTILSRPKCNFMGSMRISSIISLKRFYIHMAPLAWQ